MNINPSQFINPGVIEYDKKRQTWLERFKKAVKRAFFLNDDEKQNWTTLGYLLTNRQLEEAERLIINQDLSRLRSKQQIEKNKKQPNQ
ncbi:hypothetical protein KKA33_03195 [Patescibacteria group bacterium]|nr:hypothetical protein [Patescibacteria group bacterium]